MAPEDLRLRFGRPLRDVPATELARMTQIDYEREMAFVATNAAMFALARRLGFAVDLVEDSRTAVVTLELKPDIHPEP